MHRRVWIDEWQMQSCGDPIRLGHHVRLSTTTQVDRQFLGAVLGTEGAAAVTDYEDHHDLDVGPMAPLSGTVERIEAIFCRYELQDQALYPVAGTTRTVLREEATGWEPGDEDDSIRFVGYVVTVNSG